MGQDPVPKGAATEDRKGRRAFWRHLPLGLVLLALGLVVATGAHRSLSLEALIEERDRLDAFVAAHRVAGLLLYMIVYILAVTLSIPVAVFLTMLGGFLFGWLVGGAAAAVSGTIGAMGIFLVARTSFGDALARRAGPRVRRLAAGFEEDAFSYLLFLRFLPIVPFWVTNLAAALFRVPPRTFLIATQIGIVPLTFAFAIAGSGLDGIIEAQQRARQACLAAGGRECGLSLGPEALLTPAMTAVFAALGVLALAPIAAKRLYGRRIVKLGRGERSPAPDPRGDPA